MAELTPQLVAVIKEKGNHLKGESSLYLQQHAHNPLNWYPWREEALSLALQSDKPIFLSIGYSSCHWCHVMEEEVFSHDDIAEFMNNNFICIKVDREERPDIDAIYMDAVVALSGSGGWPMSVFLTPQLKPFYGGTYYNHDQFMSLSHEIDRIFRTKRVDFDDQASRLTEAIKTSFPTSDPARISLELLSGAGVSALQHLDTTWGGFQGRMKFPTPVRWLFLLHLYRKTANHDIAKAIKLTLDSMASGGIYDHLGGGFHRYSVDAEWLIPHFEKMLYDNAQLASIYFEAGIVLQEKNYLRIGEDILNHLINDMQLNSGGLSASIDADSPDGEGAYYSFNPEELRAIVPEKDAEELIEILGVSETGNFEGSNILTRRSAGDSGELFDRYRQDLLTFRKKRQPPNRDEKIVTAWNGLAISAFCAGYNATGNQNYLEAAKRVADYLIERHLDGSTLIRATTGGEGDGDGILDDYAFTANGMLDLFSATGDDRYLKICLTLLDTVQEEFSDDDGSWFYTSVSRDVPLERRKDLFDSVEPSGVSSMLHFLIRIASVTSSELLRQQCRNVVENHANWISKSGMEMAGWLDVALLLHGPFREIVVISPAKSSDIDPFLAIIRKNMPFHAVLIPWQDGNTTQVTALSGLLEGKMAEDNQTSAYICDWGACKLPTSSPEQALSNLFEGWNN